MTIMIDSTVIAVCGDEIVEGKVTGMSTLQYFIGICREDALIQLETATGTRLVFLSQVTGVTR